MAFRIREMTETKLERDLPTIALLAEPVRRALYEYVAGRREPVGREEAARETGISRSLAAFHLDRLVEAGLLDADYARLSGRSGPGAGRPAKLYRRSARDFEVSVPARDYELPARLLADVTASSSRSRRSAEERARAVGVELGGEASRRAGSPRSRARLLAAMRDVLEERGFQPQPEGKRGLRLQNCPFDVLAREHTDLMCGMNHALLSGMLEGLGLSGVEAVLESKPGWCCVAFRW
jgi:predicted ArsR family transcriptional regulator